MSKRKAGKPSKKRTSKVRLPKKNEYVWKILTHLIKDAEDDTREQPLVIEACQELKLIVRQRSIEKYVLFCDKWSLPVLNKLGKAFCTDESVREIRWLRLFTLAQKFDFSDSPFDQHKNALDKFYEFEDRCRETNMEKLFYDCWLDDIPGNFLEDTFYSPALQYASEFIRKVLDDEPMLQEFLNAVHHGPGATAEKAGNESVAILKNYPPFGVTPAAENLLKDSIISDQRWYRSLNHLYNVKRRSANNEEIHVECNPFVHDVVNEFVETVDYSRILFVPKNSKTLRTIAAEPTGNVYLQLALNDVIRMRLKNRVGIDLQTQAKNQELALCGSIHNDLVTLDLSGASDTIAHIWLTLFPKKWAELLDRLRCPGGILPDGTKVLFEKLSSMGNGYTFCVETLIFASLTYAVIKMQGASWKEEIPQIAIYGDDIIIPRRFYSDLVRLLTRFGFEINISKTFSAGPIRESCGTDFFNGQLISRPTLKSTPKFAWELTRDHNLLYLLSKDYGLGLDSTLTRLKNWIPSAFQHIGPVQRDDLICWIFASDMPEGTVIYINNHKVPESILWQTPVIKLKKHVLYRKASKRRSGIYAHIFLPLMYLSSPNGKPPWWKEKDPRLKIPIAISSDDWFFNKTVVSVRTSVVIYPLYVWG